VQPAPHETVGLLIEWLIAALRLVSKRSSVALRVPSRRVVDQPLRFEEGLLGDRNWACAWISAFIFLFRRSSGPMARPDAVVAGSFAVKAALIFAITGGRSIGAFAMLTSKK